MTTQPDSKLIRQVLQVAAQATEPIGRFDITHAIDPGTENLQEDTPEHEAFLRRRIEIIRAAVEAEQAGLLDCVRPAGDGGRDLLQLSERGRERLQRHR